MKEERILDEKEVVRLLRKIRSGNAHDTQEVFFFIMKNYEFVEEDDYLREIAHALFGSGVLSSSYIIPSLCKLKLRHLRDIARNPNADQSILEAVIDHSQPFIWREVINNPNFKLTSQVLPKLLSCKDPWFNAELAKVASKQNLPAITLVLKLKTQRRPSWLK